MKIDPTERTIHFRQSWLDTASRCPEEGRLAIVKDWDGVTDESFIGTASHAGIERVINGGTYEEGLQAVRDEYDNNPEALVIKFTKRDSIHTCIQISLDCFTAWWNDIRPIIPPGRAEVGFKVTLFEYEGYKIGLEGTVDYVPDEGNELWDWKTSGKRYQQKKKQMWAVQPTAYSVAAVSGALGRDGFSFPLNFNYGVMVKNKVPVGQVVTVQRTAEHWRWLRHRMEAFVELGLHYGFERQWPAIDEDNYLCSQTWCAYYDICRGAFVSRDMDLFGYVPK